VKGNIVLSDKLKEFCFTGTLPPVIDEAAPILSPFLTQISCYRNITYGSVKPNVKDFFLLTVPGNRNSPLEIPRDCPFPKPVPHPGLGHLYRVIRPKTIDRRYPDPLFKTLLDPGKVDIKMFRFFYLWSIAAAGTSGLFKFSWVKELAAVFTLVPARVCGAAVGTETPDIAVCEKTAAVLAVELFNFAFHNKASFIQFFENVLGNLGVYLCRSASESIKGNMKPAVNIIVDCEITITEFPGTYAFLGGPGFSGGTVFIGATHIQGLATAESAKTGKHVGGKNLDQVSQMGDIVHIGQRGGDEYSFHGFVIMK
jgi:hypothetical protein